MIGGNVVGVEEYDESASSVELLEISIIDDDVMDSQIIPSNDRD